MPSARRSYRRLLKMARGLPWPESPKVRKPMVAVIGGLVLLTGVGMLFLPGPAILVIPIGLALLAMEFVCVRRWFRGARRFWRRGNPGRLAWRTDPQPPAND